MPRFCNVGYVRFVCFKHLHREWHHLPRAFSWVLFNPHRTESLQSWLRTFSATQKEVCAHGLSFSNFSPLFLPLDASPSPSAGSATVISLWSVEWSGLNISYHWSHSLALFGWCFSRFLCAVSVLGFFLPSFFLPFPFLFFWKKCVVCVCVCMCMTMRNQFLSSTVHSSQQTRVVRCGCSNVAAPIIS